MKGDREEAWEKHKHYYECSNCGFAKTEVIPSATQTEVISKECQACGEKLERPVNWLRPPGFAHPIDKPEETSPEGIPDVSYATRAKLFMPFSEKEKWVKVNDRVKGLGLRTHLLVSNTGPSGEGYNYCVSCGRIEAVTNNSTLGGRHNKPFPSDDPICPGGYMSKIVLGTDFITDIGLFSIDLGPGIKLSPGNYSTEVGLRTLCEALAKAASKILEIEPNDIIAEFRPALDQKGRSGEKVEIFLYDTLPGGAGFATQLLERGVELFQCAVQLMEDCVEDCDSSCYRCLRTFKNKFEHVLIDRHIGITLARFLLTGILPPFDQRRVINAAKILNDDLIRSTTSEFTYDCDPNEGVIHIEHKDGAEYIVALCNPLTPKVPFSVAAYEILSGKRKEKAQVIPMDEFLVRNNLPSATRAVMEKIAP